VDSGITGLIESKAMLSLTHPTSCAPGRAPGGLADGPCLDAMFKTATSDALRQGRVGRLVSEFLDRAEKTESPPQRGGSHRVGSARSKECPSTDLHLHGRAELAGDARDDGQVAALHFRATLHDLPDRTDRVDDGRSRGVGHESRQRFERPATVRFYGQREHIGLRRR
jgi:hypothetical protein